MRFNFERGFRRITWVVSIAVLTIGAFLIVPDWWSALILWRKAGEPLLGEVEVYVLGVDLSVTFPKDFPETQIKDILDGKPPDELINLARSKGFHVRPPKALEDLRDEELLRLANKYGVSVPPSKPLPESPKGETIGALLQEQKLQAKQPPPRTLAEDLGLVPSSSKRSMTVYEILNPPTMAYIYQPPSGATPSVLYSQRVLLQSEAKGELSPEVKAILPVLRTNYRFPPLLVNPFGGWIISELCVLALCIAIPWGVFFLVRWIALGFKPD